MIRRILTLPQDKRILRSMCAEVKYADITDLITDLTDTLNSAPQGLGLSAPQIGSLVRVFVMRKGMQIVAFINPVILQTSIETNTAEEGCLSLPKCHARVTRAIRIHFVQQQLPHTRTIFADATGMAARVIQHELDHLDGILMTDREKERKHD
jgi:peptide deformylase